RRGKPVRVGPADPAAEGQARRGLSLRWQPVWRASHRRPEIDPRVIAAVGRDHIPSDRARRIGCFEARLPALIGIGHVTTEKGSVRSVTERLAPTPCWICGGAVLHLDQIRRRDDSHRDVTKPYILGSLDHRIELWIEHDLDGLAAAVAKIHAMSELPAQR